MSRLSNKRYFLLCGLLPEFKVEEVSLEQYKEALGLYIKDPWQRVKSIFSKDDYGNIHPELKNSIDMAQLGLVVGAFYGGIIGSVQRSQNYLHSSDTKIFQNVKSAQKMLVNQNLLGFFNGAIKYAPSFAFFLGGFTLISACCEIYRNKPSVIDSTVGGSGIGALCRFHFGSKGMVSGGIIGGVLGTLHGVLVWSISKIMKKDQLELKYAQFAFSNYRKQLLNYRQTPESDFDKTLEKSGEHKKHVTDPLNFLETESDQTGNIVEKGNK